MFTILKKIPLILFSITAGVSGTLIAQDKNVSEGADPSVSTDGKEVTDQVLVRDIDIKEEDYHYISMSKPNPFIPPLVSTLFAKVAVPIESSLQQYPLIALKCWQQRWQARWKSHDDR